MLNTPILVLTYYFPPIGGPGVQRSLKFVRYLPEEGFQPIVVAGPARGRDQWEPEDASMLGELPEDLVLYRPEDEPPGRDASSTRLTRFLGLSTRRFRWWRDRASEIGLRAAREHGAALVYVSASPFEGIGAATRIGRALGIPVIADLRDPWALDEVRIYPTSLHRWIASRTMAATLSAADLIVMNTPEAEKIVRRTLPIVAARCHHITNGYDAKDFVQGNRNVDRNHFVIVHAGFLHTEVGLSHRRRARLRRLTGGEVVPINLLARSHFYLLQALEVLCSEEPSLMDRIRVKLIGPVTEKDRECVARSPIARIVHFEGYLSHRNSIAALTSADLLFLPMHGLPTGSRARMVPGKLYEYLASGRPILGAVPEGDARDFIEQARAGRIVKPEDVGALARAIRAFLREAPIPDRSLGPWVTRFERRALTKSIAMHMRQVLGGFRNRDGSS